MRIESRLDAPVVGFVRVSVISESCADGGGRVQFCDRTKNRKWKGELLDVGILGRGTVLLAAHAASGLSHRWRIPFWAALVGVVCPLSSSPLPRPVAAVKTHRMVAWSPQKKEN